MLRYNGLMKSRWFGCLMTSLMASLTVTTAPLQATEDAALQALVQRVDAHYAGLKAFKAQFVQRFERRLIRRTLVESGRVAFKRPGKMRWEYELPEDKLFVSDGEKTYFYLPSERQVMVSQGSSGDGAMSMTEGSPFELLAGKARLRDTFDYFRTATEPQLGGEMIELVPFKRQSAFEQIELEVDSDTGKILRLILVDAQSDRTEFSFTSIEENVEIPNEQFRFSIPAGVDVVVAPGNSPR